LLAAGLGIWVAVSEEIELDGWLLGLVYAVLTGVGIGVGVLTRRYAGRLFHPRDENTAG
jgi:hypothetical protein